ncbi:MAG: STAS domain-containing protein [Crocinitomicaceae bacterium]|nr:STAS domain-containing protein [Crocinitomicaceae bacterium]
MSLTVTTHHHINCNELILKGSPLSDLDFEPLISKVDELLDQKELNVVINLENIKLLNSLGIKSLIKVFTKCRNHGGDLYIVNISEKINQVLLLTKLNTVLNIAPSLNEAINQFAKENES